MKRSDFALVIVLALLVAVAIAGMANTYLYYKDTLTRAQEKNLTTMAESASSTVTDCFELHLEKLDLQFGEDSLARAVSAEHGDLDAAVRDLLEGLARGDASVVSVVFVPIEKAASAPQSGLPTAPNGLLDTASSWDAFLDLVDDNPAACVGYWYRSGTTEEDGFLLTLWRAARLDGRTVGFAVETLDLDAVYNQTLASMQVGSLGYCMVKDPQSTIVMHRVRSQIGSNTLVDRVEGHPEGDWNALASSQYSGIAGCEIVTSYWWDNLDAGLAKKFIGYAPAFIDGNMFVANVVMSYDELMAPLRSMWLLCIALGAVVLVLVSVGGWRLAKSAQDARHLSRELAYQQELLAQTQRVKLQERQIQHIDRVQTMGIVTSSVAHEMKNHMTPLMIYGQMLQTPDLPEADRLEAAAEVEKLSQRCSEMLAQMLSYARRRPDGLAATSFDASEAFSAAVSLVRPMCPRNVALQVDALSEPRLIIGDPSAIDQILLNLATNALYAMKESGGTLSLVWEDDPVLPDTCRLVVSDTGCGMSDEVCMQLFTTFFTTKGEDGTGLGMSVVQSLVQSMRGSIEVDSALGRGSTFTVRLPLASS